MSKVAHSSHFSKRQSTALNPGCLKGAFYRSPKQGENIDTSQSLNIQWDTSLDCFSSRSVDIYLYAPYADGDQSVIKKWVDVSYSSGNYQTTLAGSWWNSSAAPISLNLKFAESEGPVVNSPVPAGPIFTSTFNSSDFALKHPTGASTTSSEASGGGISQTVGNAYKNSGLPKGNIAAAVLVPLLVVAISIAVYVKFQRAKEAERRKRWSQAVDKRMSTISSEWKGLPPSAQSEAIRQSIAIMRDSRASIARMSSAYGDEGRASRTFSTNSSGATGVGARKVTGVGPRNPSMNSEQMSQRKSTVSFAPDTRFSSSSSNIPEVPKVIPRPSTEKIRPSTETQRGRASRAFHTAISSTNLDDLDVMMSPTQKGGPMMVGDKHIKQLELGNEDNLTPALNDHTSANIGGDFLILAHSPLETSHSPIASPPATHLTPTSATPFTNITPYSPSYANIPPVPSPNQNNPFAGFTRGPSNMMSPDAMLRAYASRDGMTSAPGTRMAVAHSASSSPPAKARYYPAFDAPAQPQRVHDADRTPEPAVGRTLYTPGQGRASAERH